MRYPLLCVLFFSFLACKPRSSGISSITKSELEACGPFNGSRMLFMVNPEPDFQDDVTETHRMFLKQMSGDNLMTQYSYFTDSEGQISKPCAFYVASDQAKYEVGVPTLSGKLATREGLEKSLEALGRRIAAKRQEVAAAENKDGYQVQIMLVFSSHGTRIDTRAHPSGGLVLSAPSVTSPSRTSFPTSSEVKHDILPFEDLVGLIQKYLVTPCVPGDGQCQSGADGRKADEIVILTDACFGGSMNVALQQRMGTMLGYQAPLTPASKATRLISLTSSSQHQISVASFANSGRGTLIEMLSMSLNHWLPDLNHDHIISYPELIEFITKRSFLGTINSTNKIIASILKDVIAPPQENNPGSDSKMKRKTFFAEARAYAQKYTQLFQDPVQALQRFAYFEDYVSIQQPTAFHNLAPDYLGKLLFAVRGKPGHAQASEPMSPEDEQMHIEAQKFHLRELVVLWEAIVRFAEKNSLPTGPIPESSLDLKKAPMIYSFVMGGSPQEPDDEPEVVALKVNSLEVLRELKSIDGGEQMTLIDGQIGASMDPYRDFCTIVSSRIPAGKVEILIASKKDYGISSQYTFANNSGFAMTCHTKSDNDAEEVINTQIAKDLIKIDFEEVAGFDG